MKKLTEFMNKDLKFPNEYKAETASEWIDLEVIRINKAGGKAYRREKGDKVAIYIPSSKEGSNE